MKQTIGLGLVGLVALLQLTACGGGGGGSDRPVLYYPYETVFGDVCTGELEPVPGCTFRRIDGLRVTVAEDRDFNRTGRGSDDLRLVEFQDEFSGTFGYIYRINSFGRRELVDRVPIEQFQGHQFGSQIGVGSTGLFWVDVTSPFSGNRFWMGPSSGVLYDANSISATFGQAINNSGNALTDTNSFAARHEMRASAIDQAAIGLRKRLSFLDSATALNTARALDQIATAYATARGALSLPEQDQQFERFFGVNAGQARREVLTAYATNDIDKAAPSFNETHRHFGFAEQRQTAQFLRTIFRSADSELEIDLDKVLEDVNAKF